MSTVLKALRRAVTALDTVISVGIIVLIVVMIGVGV